jgi:hypothetical protein
VTSRAGMLLAGVTTVSFLLGCGANSSTSSTPHTPTITLPPMTLPTPTPPPTPPPITASCFPTPPPVHGMKLKVQSGSGDRKLLDSRPIVKNLDGYCARTGQSANAPYCDTRVEGDPQREACDALAVGRARDTGRWGPTWTVNDQPCEPYGTVGALCVNHPDNQFMVIAKGSGFYLACPEDGPCGGYEY